MTLVEPLYKPLLSPGFDAYVASRGYSVHYLPALIHGGATFQKPRPFIFHDRPP